MKNNKGFTLIEVLAVVAILITVIAIITPKIFKQFKTAENVTDQEQINTLINTSKIYMNQNANLLPEENDLYVISLSELKESGLIQTSQILNPSTKEELTGCILVKYENNKYKYEYKEESDLITVTFDPNGGSVDQTTKEVIYNEKYGKLPTPTREGYTFMGWNGKNLLNYNELLVVAKYYGIQVDENGFIYKIGDNDYRTWFYESCDWHLSLDSGSYILTLYFSKKAVSDSANTYSGIRIVDTDDTLIKSSVEILNNRLYDVEKQSLMFTLEEQIDAGIIVKAYDGVYRIQLEEGDTATEWEPYYVLSSTPVTQAQNHTLKAIWKANE